MSERRLDAPSDVRATDRRGPLKGRVDPNATAGGLVAQPAGPQENGNETGGGLGLR